MDCVHCRYEKYFIKSLTGVVADQNIQFGQAEFEDNQRIEALSLNEHVSSEESKSLEDDKSKKKKVNGKRKSKNDSCSTKSSDKSKKKGNVFSNFSFIRMLKSLTGASGLDLKDMHYSDWTSGTKSRQHVWFQYTRVFGKCSVPNCQGCYDVYDLMKCSVCRVMACISCRIKIPNTCLKTFFTAYEAEKVLAGNHKHLLRHFWIHKNNVNQDCANCKENISGQTILSQKGPSSIHCAWCKGCYHNNATCFTKQVFEETCDMGTLRNIIIHPVQIQKLEKIPDELEKYEINQYQITAAQKLNTAMITNIHKLTQKNSLIIMNSHYYPMLVLVNPKSGSNVGFEVLCKMQWHLNPRQVFDLTTISLERILPLFANLEKLRIVVAGGDGTISQVLTIITNFPTFPSFKPPIAIIPLGTGNDLANELQWGSAYAGEDTLKGTLIDALMSKTQKIDIWSMSVKPMTPDKNATKKNTLNQNPTLKVNISEVNEELESSPYQFSTEKFINYFSIGCDAATVTYHQSRAKKPQNHQSRFKNKMFYAEAGGKDFFKREFKDLVDHMSLMCDGVSYDAKLAELRPHCIVALNIANYCSGLNPWGKSKTQPTETNTDPDHSNASRSTNASKVISKSDTKAFDFLPQAVDDGYLEIIGLSATSLPTLQYNGQGERICQCRNLKIEIKQELPIQLDGEPCLVKPCTLQIEKLYQYPFVKRRKN